MYINKLTAGHDFDPDGAWAFSYYFLSCHETHVVARIYAIPLTYLTRTFSLHEIATSLQCVVHRTISAFNSHKKVGGTASTRFHAL